jgi:hypothetical protein
MILYKIFFPLQALLVLPGSIHLHPGLPHQALVRPGPPLAQHVRPHSSPPGQGVPSSASPTPSVPAAVPVDPPPAATPHGDPFCALVLRGGTRSDRPCALVLRGGARGGPSCALVFRGCARGGPSCVIRDRHGPGFCGWSCELSGGDRPLDVPQTTSGSRLLPAHPRAFPERSTSPLQLHPLPASLCQARLAPSDGRRPHPTSHQLPRHEHARQVWVPATSCRPALRGTLPYSSFLP